MALATLLTLPRVPQLYYGTEILMENTEKPHDHGRIRTDFPGGWKGDKINAFTGKGLSKEQIELQNTLSRLLDTERTVKPFKRGNSPTLHLSMVSMYCIVLFKTKKWS